MCPRTAPGRRLDGLPRCDGFIATDNLSPLREQQLVVCDTVDSACQRGLMDNGFALAEKNASCTSLPPRWGALKAPSFPPRDVILLGVYYTHLRYRPGCQLLECAQRDDIFTNVGILTKFLKKHAACSVEDKRPKKLCVDGAGRWRKQGFISRPASSYPVGRSAAEVGLALVGVS